MNINNKCTIDIDSRELCNKISDIFNTPNISESFFIEDLKFKAKFNICFKK